MTPSSDADVLKSLLSRVREEEADASQAAESAEFTAGLRIVSPDPGLVAMYRRMAEKHREAAARLRAWGDALERTIQRISE